MLRIIDEKIMGVMRVVAIGCGGVFLAIAILMAVHTVGRYGFSSPIMGQTEIVSVLQLCAVALGGWYVQAAREHIMIGLLVDKLSPKKQAVIDFITYSLCFVFCVIVSWQTFVYSIQQLHSGRYTLTLHIPYGPFYVILAIGWAMVAFATLLNLIRFAIVIKGTSEEQKI